MWGVFGEVGVTGGDFSLLDPTKERMVGRKASPWNTPYNTVSPKTLKIGNEKGDEEDDEDLEEGDEDVGGGKGKDDDRQQGGDARVHDGRAKGDQGILSPFRWRA